MKRAIVAFARYHGKNPSCRIAGLGQIVDPITGPSNGNIMQQVKIFKSIESEREELEKEINRWIRRSGARVLSVTGNITTNGGGGGPMSSFSGSDILVMLLVEIDLPKPAESRPAE